jgi:hypothetical protein
VALVELVELVELVAKNHLKIGGPSRDLDYKPTPPDFYTNIRFVNALAHNF